MNLLKASYIFVDYVPELVEITLKHDSVFLNVLTTQVTFLYIMQNIRC